MWVSASGQSARGTCGQCQGSGLCGCPDMDSKQAPTCMHEKDTVKYGPFFAHVGLKCGDVLDKQAQQVGYIRIEKVCLFL